MSMAIRGMRRVAVQPYLILILSIASHTIAQRAWPAYLSAA